jgi:nucleoside-diphosphate kinase
MTTVQKTLAIIKPNVFRDGHVDEALDRIGREGFVVADKRVEQLDEARAKTFYAEHAEKPFYERLVRYMTAGPCMLLVLAREDAISKWRDVIGPTAAAKDHAPNSLRALYGTDLENGFHGSDSMATARREILFFFKNCESKC